MKSSILKSKDSSSNQGWLWSSRFFILQCLVSICAKWTKGARIRKAVAVQSRSYYHCGTILEQDDIGQEADEQNNNDTQICSDKRLCPAVPYRSLLSPSIHTHQAVLFDRNRAAAQIRGSETCETLPRADDFI